MVVICNQFIDDDNLTDKSSLIHLLDRHDADDCDEIPLLKHSPFYSENQFTSLLNKKYGLCILDMNIANAFTKFDELEAFIYRVNKGNPISVICLNECWLSEIRDGSNLNLTNYNLFNQIGKCPGHSHCGLLIYVHEDYKCNELIINQMTTGWEYLCIEISHNSPNSRKYIISNIYRPPEKYIEELDIFIEEFEIFLTIIKHYKKSAFICGDFNINLLEINNNRHFNTYFDSIIAKGFFPIITLPTRIEASSCTLIDNILTNNIDETAQSKSGLLVNDITDHKIIFTYLINNSHKIKMEKFIKIEKNDRVSMESFAGELKNLNIYDKMNKNINCCPQDNYEVFASLVKFAKEKHLPSKIVKYNKRKHMKSKWMTDGILKSINTKDKLYTILIQTYPEDEHLYTRLKSEFITHRTDLRRNIREAKRMYYTRTFDLYKNDI